MALVDMVQPPLTTIRINLSQMGREAAALLLERIRAQTAPIQHVFSEPQLIVRGSTASPTQTAQTVPVRLVRL